VYSIDLDDYEGRIRNTAAWLEEHVGPKIDQAYSYKMGEGWQMTMLGASGFCGNQLWLLIIYDPEKEAEFQKTHQYGIINEVPKEHITKLLKAHQTRMIAVMRDHKLS
jgi:hypothetical protein